MKRFFSLMLVACLLLIAAGCKKNIDTDNASTIQTESTAPTEGAAKAPVSMSASYAAVSLPIETHTTTAEDGTVVFTNSYQSMRLTLSGQVTADLIITDFMSRVDSATANADTLKESAIKQYPNTDNWTPYANTLRYTPTRIDSTVLSLYGTNISYTGGSHPTYTCMSANYNLISGDALTLGSILVHEDKTTVLQDLIIEKLDMQAEEKYLQEAYKNVIVDRFSGDESFDEQWYFSDAGLCFYFAPYEIAPYSSGVIVAEIPYSELVGIIADEYFPPESVLTNGNATVLPFSLENAQKYAQTSDFVLDPEGEQYLIEVDSCIQNISISILAENPGGEVRETVYKAYYLNPGDAIMVQATRENAEKLVIHYKQGNNEITVPLVSS